jgi:hypothetical protein
LAERGLDAATQPHGQTHLLRRPPVHHVLSQWRHQFDAKFGELGAQFG